MGHSSGVKVIHSAFMICVRGCMHARCEPVSSIPTNSNKSTVKAWNQHRCGAKKHWVAPHLEGQHRASKDGADGHGDWQSGQHQRRGDEAGHDALEDEVGNLGDVGGGEGGC